MLRIITLSIVAILNIVLQSTVIQAMGIYNVSFNLFVITVVSFSLIRGQREGMLLGFGIGFMQDLFFGSFLGMYALLYLYIGFVVGHFSKSFFKDSYLIPVSAIAASDLALNLIIYLSFLFRGRTQFFFYFFTKILPEVSYTALAAILFYRLYLMLDNRLEYYNRWKGSRNKL